MRTHQRLLATAAMAVGVLLSPSTVYAESGGAEASLIRQRQADAASIEFGNKAVPQEGLTDIVAQRPPAAAGDAIDGEIMMEGSGRRRLMWWNWFVAGCKFPFDRRPLAVVRSPWLARFRRAPNLLVVDR